MSTISEQRTPGAVPQEGVRVSSFLQPIAAPSVLGYFAAASGFLLFECGLRARLAVSRYGPRRRPSGRKFFSTVTSAAGSLASTPARRASAMLLWLLPTLADSTNALGAPFALMRTHRP